MNKKKRCNCKKSIMQEIKGVGVICKNCKKWISKIRKKFYRKTKKMSSKKKYDRDRRKRIVRKRINKQLKEGE